MSGKEGDENEWANFTNKLVKVLCVSIPKIFKQK